jgi:predicted Zn-ribbon and HTH transcriptional regulator
MSDIFAKVVDKLFSPNETEFYSHSDVVRLTEQSIKYNKYYMCSNLQCNWKFTELPNHWNKVPSKCPTCNSDIIEDK